MTVAELVSVLREFSPDAKVKVAVWEVGDDEVRTHTVDWVQQGRDAVLIEHTP